MFTDTSLFSSDNDKKTSFLHVLSKKDWILIGCMSSGLLFVLVGILLLIFQAEPIQAKTPASVVGTLESSIFVDVGGAVAKPGIYSVSSDARVATALSAAGGLTELADNSYISQSLNLAKSITDGEKIYVPYMVGRPDTAIEQNLEFTENATDSLVSINNATQSQLDELPKVGEVTAEKIINGRPYASINELIEKKIVSSAVWTEISSLIKI